MTKFKVCAKIHLFIIISSLFIAIGMAVGTICHFCANGFFNYGGEFKSYNSVNIVYYTSEYKDEEAIKPICDEALSGFNAFEVSCYSDGKLGGEIIYKFSAGTDVEKLQAAVDELNVKLDKNNSGLNRADVHSGVIKEGGSRAVTSSARRSRRYWLAYTIWAFSWLLRQ